MFLRRSWLFVLGILATLSCGDGHDHEHGDVDHESCLGDEEEPQGASKLGEEGRFKVHILATEPAPLLVGNNSFTIRITDPEDNPVEGVTFDILETWQRLHNHGSPVVPQTTALEDPGEFQIDDLNVIHPGSWLFRFGPRAGDQSDFIEFNFGVECAD